jgi:hypothetical protein
MTPGQSHDAVPPPQGIDEFNLQRPWWHRHANPASIIVIGALLAAALLGTFGGQPHPHRKIATPAADVETEFPEILRNGEFFEMRAAITARRRFEDLRLAVAVPYWRDLTINTMVPAPSEETSENGEYIFGYGEVKAGQTLNLKFDGQINPPMFAGTQGAVRVMDGEETIAVIPVNLRVYP